VIANWLCSGLPLKFSLSTETHFVGNPIFFMQSSGLFDRNILVSKSNVKFREFLLAAIP
jgi:hypothetical protein